MAITTPTSKSYNMILRDYYSGYREATKTSSRLTMGNNQLIKADSKAMQKISSALKDMEYSTDTGTDIYRNVKAFVEAYNNLAASTDKSDEYSISNPTKLLKKLTKEEKESLSEIGITITASGKLEMKEETFLEATPKKIASVFSQDSSFTQKVKQYAGKIYNASRHINTMA